MNQQISLKDAERRAFLFYSRDGLLDIFLGFVFCLFAIAPYLSESLGDFWSSVVFVPVWGLVFIVLWLIRKYVIRPRAGQVTFGAWRKKRLIQFNVLMFIVLGGSMGLGALCFVFFGEMQSWVPVAILSTTLLIGSGLAGYYLDYTFLYVYGVLLATAPVVGEWLWRNAGVSHHGYPITFGFVSGFMILVGLIQLFRLLRRYPSPSGGA